MQALGVRLVGINVQTGERLLVTVAFVVAAWLVHRLLAGLLRLLLAQRQRERTWFWTRQVLDLIAAVVVLLGLFSLWFQDPTHQATAIGLVTAGLAFALQKVVTAVAGYVVILRGKDFTVGDRITLGGVRGDVIAIGFIQTTILEMGQPVAGATAGADTWVRSSQHTGRVVTVSNAKIFDEPVYNYTRDFPYLWEEIAIPISYGADRARAEQILLESTGRHTDPIRERGEADLMVLQGRYPVQAEDLTPKVYYRITDNWLELTVRFLVNERGIREVKDGISRDVLTGLEAAGIDIASATYDIVGLPPIRLESDGLPRRPK